MKITHKQALMRLLSDRREHHMRELIQVGGYRYGGRLHELRREGCVIETIQKGIGEYTYRLLSDGMTRTTAGMPAPAVVE